MFDPYHKWLGISPKDQPPNYYRLLGIDLFESDPDVIDTAANTSPGANAAYIGHGNEINFIRQKGAQSWSNGFFPKTKSHLFVFIFHTSIFFRAPGLIKNRFLFGNGIASNMRSTPGKLFRSTTFRFSISHQNSVEFRPASNRP